MSGTRIWLLITIVGLALAVDVWFLKSKPLYPVKAATSSDATTTSEINAQYARPPPPPSSPPSSPHSAVQDTLVPPVRPSRCTKGCYEDRFIGAPTTRCCTCCANRVVTAHKMGFLLSRHLQTRLFRNKIGFAADSIFNNTVKAGWWRDDFFKDFQSDNVIRLDINGNVAKPLFRDIFREVVVTRNFVDSLVSGYLYHLSGKECWLNPFGEAQKFERGGSHIPHSPLEHMNVSREFVESHVPVEKQINICRILNHLEESKNASVAVWAYMDWAFTDHYDALLAYATMMKNNHTQNTMFVCYEDIIRAQSKLTSNTTFDTNDENVIQSMIDWFAVSVERPYGIPPIHLDVKRLGNNKREKKGHTSTEDQQLRRNIADIVRSLDINSFEGRVSYADGLLGCSK